MKRKVTLSATSQNRGFKAWWKKHWKKVVAGVVVVVGGTILVIRNWDELVVAAEKLAAKLKPEEKLQPLVDVPEVVEEIDIAPVVELVKDAVRKSPEDPFDVTSHIRNLPEGRHASPGKIAEAMEHQIVLLPNQTFVSGYTKGIKVA